jgi:hypothetical protein
VEGVGGGFGDDGAGGRKESQEGLSTRVPVCG